jgi:poly(3-hydroxybutyrate) depolymerase
MPIETDAHKITQHPSPVTINTYIHVQVPTTMASKALQALRSQGLWLYIIIVILLSGMSNAQEEASSEVEWHGIRAKRNNANTGLAEQPSDKAQKQQQEPTCENLPHSHSAENMITLKRPGKMSRQYRLHTPANYNRNLPSKLVLAFHGWGETSTSYMHPDWIQAAEDYNYIVVMPEGIQKSWQFPGSANGYGRDGTSITTCDLDMIDGPDYCYSETCDCPNRCGWTQCQDDDVDFVLDLIDDLYRQVCVDRLRIYATGISNGGMLTWTLGQDKRTASKMAALAPMIGVPHFDFTWGPATEYALPVIGIYGNFDDVVPPGGFHENLIEDSDGYYWVPAHRLHPRWAMDHGCPITDGGNGLPPIAYGTGDVDLQGFQVQCRSYCNTNDGTYQVPFSVDCRAEMGHDTPVWMMHVALRFFEQHYLQGYGSKRNRNGAPKEAPASSKSTSLTAPEDHLFD